jgi:hypothetical protein
MLALQNDKSIPARRFAWRTRDGQHIDVSRMETRHLFYTLRMIWNHTMPKDAKLKPYRSYAFSSFYTEQYLKEAIRHIFHELTGRKDISKRFVKELEIMAKYVLKYKLEYYDA